jgi:hypothetical protein
VAQGAQGADSPASVPRVEPAPCPKLPGADELAKASCFYLVVPEDRSRPDGPTIRLLVAKYPARSPEKQPDPVVYLAGGPGDIVPLEINALIAADFIRDRDVYGMSQRGTMFSEPALTCAAADNFARELLGMRLFRRDQARASGSDRGLPPRVHRDRRRPRCLQFDRERGRFRRSSQSARHRRVECLRDILWLISRADAHA